MHCRRVIVFLGFLTALTRLEPAMAGVDELLLRVPRDANTLVLINVDRILNSPLGKQEGWRDKCAQEYVDTPMMLPPDASRLVLSAAIDFSNWTPSWEAAAMDMTDSPSIVEIAKAERGHLDTLGGARAAWTPFDAYFVELSPRMMGVLHPAKRQFAARWVEDGKNKKALSLSHFLHGVARHPDADEITMALDLEDVMGPDQLLQELEQSKVLKGNKADLGALSQLLSSVKGVTLRVHIKEKMIGDFAIHFGKDVSAIKDYAKPLVLEFLANAGASVEDFKAWNPRLSPEGTIVSIEGPLSNRGLRRLMSVVELPTPRKGPASGQNSATPANPAEATQKHFQAVTMLLNDLREKEGNDTLGHQDMIWMQRYARKIDRLPLLNVDPDMQGYSGQVSAMLLQAANALEGTGQAARAGAAAYHSGAAYWGYWGTGGGAGGNTFNVADYDRREHWNIQGAQEAARQDRIGQKKQVWAQQQAAGTDAARQILAQIVDMTVQVRTQMTDRYHINF